MFNLFKLFKREDRLFGAIRSSKWPRVRRDWLSAHPTCAVCGKKAKLLNPLEVHHCIPVSIDASKELDLDNLIALCPKDHLLFGHLNSFHSFNSSVREDCENWSAKIKTRP